MWTEQSVSRCEPAGCLFMPAELCRFTAVMPARVCRQLRVPSRPSLCQSTLLRPVSQHLWRACSMHYQESQPYLCLPTGLHWRPVHTVSTHTWVSSSANINFLENKIDYLKVWYLITRPRHYFYISIVYDCFFFIQEYFFYKVIWFFNIFNLFCKYNLQPINQVF